MTDAPLRIRAANADDRAIRRTFELAPSHTLAELHAVLVREFRLEPEHQWAFFLSGEWLDRASEFGGGSDLPGERDAREARVGELGLRPGDVIAYLNDFGDEQRLELEVVGVGEPGDSPAEPRVLSREGEPRARPEPPDDPSVEPPLRPAPPLPPEALAELRAARDAWTLGAERPAARVALGLDRVASLATALVNACASGEDLVALAEAEDWAIEKWLGEATRALAAEGDGDAALCVAERLGTIGRTRQPLVTVALAFAEAGRADLARRAIAAATAADAPLFPRSRLGLVQARLLLGDTGEAEADLRRLLDARWPSPKVRPLAARALGSLLEATGRSAEAEELRASERERDAARKGVVRREAPKVGRNDPCPCGSGKKYKKCHG